MHNYAIRCTSISTEYKIKKHFAQYKLGIKHLTCQNLKKYYGYHDGIIRHFDTAIQAHKTYRCKSVTLKEAQKLYLENAKELKAKKAAITKCKKTVTTKNLPIRISKQYTAQEIKTLPKFRKMTDDQLGSVIGRRATMKFREYYKLSGGNLSDKVTVLRALWQSEGSSKVVPAKVTKKKHIKFVIKCTQGLSDYMCALDKRASDAWSFTGLHQYYMYDNSKVPDVRIVMHSKKHPDYELLTLTQAQKKYPAFTPKKVEKLKVIAKKPEVKPFTLADLKIGMHITTKERIYDYIDLKDIDLITGKCASNPDFSITQVVDANYVTIWTPPLIKKVTKAEIAEKFGVSVDQLKII